MGFRGGRRMTREESIDWLARVKSNTVNHTLEMPLWWNEPLAGALDMAIKALEQEPNRNMEEIKEVINCDADAETKCKMISNILTTKPHYFEEPQKSEETE